MSVFEYLGKTPPVRLARSAFKLIELMSRPIRWVAVRIYRYLVMTLALASAIGLSLGRELWKWITNYNPDDPDVAFGKVVRGYMNDATTRIPFAIVALIVGTPLVFFALVAVFVGVFGVLLVVFDQKLYPTFPVSGTFVNVDSTPTDGVKPTTEDIGFALLGASYYQFEQELDSFLGWTPNDMFGLQYLDNRKNRQLGVRHATIEILRVMGPNITRYGSTDATDPRLVTAQQSGISYDPYHWILPASENEIRNNGFDLLKDFQSDLRENVGGAHINITNENIVAILNAVDTALAFPHDSMISRNQSVSYFELDDRVFFAQGASIPARDVLTVIRASFADKIEERGALQNLDLAIDSLEGVLVYHPWVITRGADDSIVADSRAKVARYFNEARKRLNDVIDALQN